MLQHLPASLPATKAPEEKVSAAMAANACASLRAAAAAAVAAAVVAAAAALAGVGSSSESVCHSNTVYKPPAISR